MNDWASRRKSIILWLIVVILASISFSIFWKFWYKAPSCFDNVKNGDEVNVDCGGSCSLVCSGSTFAPIVRWDPRIFEVVPGTWSALVYVENPNISTEVSYLPYTFTIYGEKNEVLEKREGATILPKNETVGIFEGGIVIEKGKPKRATFELGDNIIWKKNEEKAPLLEITHSPLLRGETMPRVEATIKNDEIYDIKNIELVVSIFDGSDNAIAASRTFIENLKKGESSNVFFTWPKPFELGEMACEIPSSVVLAIDRSGSMASISKSPPEPLTSVKKAASYFISELKGHDKAGLVAFANYAENPTNFALTENFDSLKQSIDGLSILEDGVQYTNIADAITKSTETFLVDENTTNQKILVLLTDGVATRPVDPKGSKTEEEEIAYAEEVAEMAASEARKNNIMIYTIGLGKDIHQDFLKKIASTPANFLEAPATSTLQSIYDKISTSICKEVPARIEITYKIFGDSL